jgi:hypothetical protein
MLLIKAVYTDKSRLQQIKAVYSDCKKKPPSKAEAYWNECGKFSPLCHLIDKYLIPPTGPSDWSFAECYRHLSKLYYDCYNNGGGNIVMCYGSYIDFVENYCKDNIKLGRDEKEAIQDLYQFIDHGNESEDDSDCTGDEIDAYIQNLDLLVDAVCDDLAARWIAHLNNKSIS